MNTYRNPIDGPAVEFAGPVSFAAVDVARACREWAPQLEVSRGIDPVRLLWALCGNESGFGKDARPRHEMAYCTGRYSRDGRLPELTKRFGHAAHCSFGVTQVMLCNVPGEVADLGAFDTASGCLAVTVLHLNEAVLRTRAAVTLVQIFDAYNSGNWRDANVPEEYIRRGLQNYKLPMP